MALGLVGGAGRGLDDRIYIKGAHTRFVGQNKTRGRYTMTNRENFGRFYDWRLLHREASMLV